MDGILKIDPIKIDNSSYKPRCPQCYSDNHGQSFMIASPHYDPVFDFKVNDPYPAMSLPYSKLCDDKWHKYYYVIEDMYGVKSYSDKYQALRKYMEAVQDSTSLVEFWDVQVRPYKVLSRTARWVIL